MSLRFLWAAAAALVSLQLAEAQPFAITAQVNQTTVTVSPGGTLNVTAPAIGTPTTIRLTVSYRGATSANVTGVDGVGAGDFAFSGVATPVQLPSGSSFQESIVYTPISGQPAQAQLSVTYLEDKATSPTTFFINISGTAPDLVYSYAFSGGNAQAVADGAQIQFPSTEVNATRTATFTVLNRGSGAGSISNIALTGTAFQLGGLQIPPYTLAPAGALSFNVTFAPTDRSTQTGTLTVTFAGRTYNFTLRGTGTSANYVYTIVRADSTTASVQPGQSIGFPDTNVGSNTSLTLQVANTGNGTGTISTISILGSGYQITATPFLPANIPVGGQVQLTLLFTPTTPGPLPGALKVGDDTFALNGTGIGPLLTFGYSVGGTSTSIKAGDPVQFSPVQIGQSGILRFTITNTGNSPSAINTIFLTGSSTFTLSNLPGLPLNLAPSDSATFNVKFAPTTVGLLQASLQIGSASFPVSGSAIAPVPLSAIQFVGPSGPAQPLQQPSYTLSLQQPYAIDVVGTLNLGFSSAVFATDPSVQFASGGKTADFFIGAGSTKAVFLNNSNQIAIQTGTVAGTINIFPTFATTTGVDLTPSSVPSITLTIPQLAPQITALTVSGQSNSGFTLSITGFATSRSVTQIQLQLTAAAGQSITNTSITIPVDSIFQAWYQSTASQAVGSAFTATLPITLTGNSTAGPSFIQAIKSVSVTLTNAQGTSTAQSVNLQ